MSASDYMVGTVSIAAGSRSLLGDGTAWLAASFKEGDVLYLKGFAIPIESFEGEDEATLSEDWPGATVTDSAYRLRFMPDLARLTAKTQALIDGLADLKGDTGAPGANFDPDAIGLFADRDDYDEEAESFSYLSTDGDGDAITSAVIFIRQGVAGEWSDPIAWQGAAGLSAYEIAVAQGFVGTEAEWLAENEGEDGIDGISAYEVALDEGFEGSEAEWLESLKGKSAYQIALDEGFEGSEAEWLADLEGIDGDDGPSAYEVALDEGFVGTEEEWLDSLKGEPGDFTPEADAALAAMAVMTADNSANLAASAVMAADVSAALVAITAIYAELTE
ncbi:MAG: hypothetical protein RIE56_01480 [Amphiplicatus sp.]